MPVLYTVDYVRVLCRCISLRIVQMYFTPEKTEPSTLSGHLHAAHTPIYSPRHAQAFTHTHTPSLTVSAGQSCPWPVIRPGQPRACCLPAGLVPPTFLSSNQPTHTHTCKHARTHTHIHCSCCPSGCPVLTIISLS